MGQRKLVKDFLESRDAVLSFILSLTRDPDVSEEVFQEVGLTVVDEDNKGTQVASFGPWVREIARHRTADYYRKQTKTRSIQPISESMGAMVCRAFDDHDLSLEENRLRQKFLRECLTHLSDRAKEAIELRYRERMSLGSIASSFGWKSTSVKVALSKARKVLLDCIQTKVRTAQVS